MSAKVSPVHPGEVLRKDFLEPLGLSRRRLALAIKVPPTRFNRIVNRQRAVTADTAWRLGRYFGTGPEFWLNLQMRFELETLEDIHGARINAEVLPRLAAV